MTDEVRRTAPRHTEFGILLNLIGIVVVTIYLVIEWNQGEVPLWAIVVASAAILAWLVLLVVPPRMRVATRILCLAMIVCGAAAAWSTNGLAIVPVIAAILPTAGDLDEPPWLTYIYAVLAAGLVAGAPLVSAANGGATPTFESIISLVFAVALATLGGVNRRQARAREAAALQLAERTAAMQAQEARASTLAARQSLARDMHDVLAHSLGGLVIQLDAVEAQLEAGKTDAALARVHDARSMAASGLAEARRAVEALRAEPDAAASVTSSDLGASLIDLVDAHERFGGRIDFEQTGEPQDVPDAVATALRRALQEALSNARKHAPGEPVTVRIRWQDDGVELDVANPVPETTDATPAPGALASSGGGRGLSGMRERFAELRGGSVAADRENGMFVVRAAADLGGRQ